MAPWMAIGFLFSFTVAFTVCAQARSSALFDSAATSCHMVTSTSEQVYVSFLSTDMSQVTLYQTVWTKVGWHLLECSNQDEESLVQVYQSFCEVSHGNITKQPFTSPQDSEVLQTLSALQKLQELCPVSSEGRFQAPHERTKREVFVGPTDHSLGEVSEGPVPQDRDAEAVLVPSLEGATRRRVKKGWTMPGTLWCGAGTTAVNFTDLGIFQGADLCCREHDHCMETMAAFEFKYGIRNYQVYTVSHCDCDFRFKHCLHDVNDTISTFVGIMFFNLLQIPCFTLEEREGCQAWHWWGGCKEYGFTSLALIQKQGHYNHTHPFSDPLDERYRLNITLESGTVSPASSAVHKVLPTHGWQDESLRPDRQQRKKAERQKHRRRPVPTNRTPAAGATLTGPLHLVESSTTRTGIHSLKTEALKVTNQVPTPMSEVMKDPAHKVIEGALSEVMQVSLSEGTMTRLPEVMNVPVPTRVEVQPHEVMDVLLHESDNSSQPEVMEVPQSDIFVNYLDEQKLVTLEPLYGMTLQSHITYPINSMALPSTDIPSIAHPSTNLPSTGQLSMAHSSTDLPSMAHPRTDPSSMAHPSTDIPSMAHPSTNPPSMAHHSTEPPIMAHPSTDHPATGQSSTDQSIRAQPFTDQLGPSWSSADQSIMAQHTKQPSTSTSATKHGQVSMKWLSTDQVTRSRMIHSSSVQPNPGVSTIRNVNGLLETSPLTGNHSMPFNVNRWGKHEAHEQTAAHHMQTYVDSPTTAPTIPTTAITSKQEPGLPTVGAGIDNRSMEESSASVFPNADPASNVSLNEKITPIHGLPTRTPHHKTVHRSSTPQYQPHKHKLNHLYVSRSCGCYHRLDQCEYKIAPNEEKFQLHNLDWRTLYHCNCTQRLARFLQRKKRPNEVEEVLFDFVSPSCFVLEPREVCSRGESCRALFTATLTEAGHLKRTLRLLQNSSRTRDPLEERGLERADGPERPQQSGTFLKVKRQELLGPGATPGPPKLYEQCVERVGKRLQRQKNLPKSRP